MARAASPAALQRAIDLVASSDGNIALKAITVILDRGYGKPMQGVELTGKDGKNWSPTVIILPSNGCETSWRGRGRMADRRRLVFALPSDKGEGGLVSKSNR